MVSWSFDADYLEEPKLSDDTISVSDELIAQRTDIVAEGETAVVVNFSARDYLISGVPDPISGGGIELGHGVYDMTFKGVPGTIFKGTAWEPGSLSGVYFDPIPATHIYLQTFSRDTTVFHEVDSGAAAALGLAAGDAICITGYDLQGGGQPPNPFWMKFARVVDVTGGAITIDEPVHFSAKSTWPVWSVGIDNSEPNHGGPATMYKMPDYWKGSVTFEDLEVDTADQVGSKKENVHFINVVWGSGENGTYPTSNKVWHWTGGSQLESSIEFDKMAEEAIIDGGAVFNIIAFQSSAGTFRIKEGSTVDNLVGGARENYYENCTINHIRYGCYAHGRTDVYDLRNVTILGTQDFTNGGVHDKGGLSDVGVDVYYTMEDGIISPVDTYNPSAWGIPGTHLFWIDEDTGKPIGKFKVIDTYREDGGTSTQRIVTDQSGGFPAFDVAPGKLGVRVHPCPSLTAIDVVNVSDQPFFVGHPAGAPMWSYWMSSTLTEDDIAGNFIGQAVGRLVSMTVNVITPVTGGSGDIHWRPSSGNNYQAVNGDYSYYTWAPEIDLRTAGVRILRPPSGGGPSGSVGADLITSGAAAVPEGMWMTGGSGMGATQDISGLSGLAMTIEIITDQDIEAETVQRPSRLHIRFR